MLQNINAQLTELSNLVSAAILNDEWELIKRSHHTIDIKVQDMEVAIWNCNGPESTRVYSVRAPDWQVFDMELPFPKPEACRNILNKMTEKEILVEQNELRLKIAALQEKLDD